MHPSNPEAPPSDDEPIAALVFDDAPLASPAHRAAPAVSIAKSEVGTAPSPAMSLAPPIVPTAVVGQVVAPPRAVTDSGGRLPVARDLTQQALLPARGLVLAPEQTPVRPLTTAPPIVRPAFRSVYAGKTLVQCIGPALLQPFRGSGPAWLGVLAGGTLVAGVSSILGAFMLLGKAFFGFVMAATVVLYARFFGACLTAAAHEYDDPGSLPDMSQFKYEIGMPLLAIGLWWMLSMLPAIVWVLATGNTSGLVLTLLVFLSLFMWPVAMTISALRRRPLLSMFDFEIYPKVILAAPKAWATVFGVLAAVYVGVWFLGWLLHATLSSVLGGMITLLIIPYLHGVAGTLVGRLLVDYPAVGEAAGADI
jgi:hypothetical protein